ncbi:MAG: AAA family ATPase [Planctomycetes bacterium]|nr:AAA family ATPase [Planctomycetota bacterium]
MLERVQIENFRCLRKVDVPLRPLTVLIGPNDSGKSVFLLALKQLVEYERFIALDAWRAEERNVIRISGNLGDCGRIEVGRAPGLQLFTVDGQNPLCPLGFYHLPSSGASMQCSEHFDVHGPPEMGLSGQFAPALLDFLLRRDRKRFDALVDAMRSLVPGLEEINIATPDPGMVRIDLVIEDGLRLPADRASAGLRLLIFFVALAYHPSPRRFILIEEPENGVHPKRLEDVMRLLREITEGRHGDHAAQIVLSTHSPHLLDYVDIEKDQVLVFRRNDDGSRTAEPADAERLKTFLDEFMLGEVWYNEGEAGLVGPAK